MSYGSLLSVTAPVLAVMAAGWAVRRCGWLSREADASLLRLVVNLLYPCLVFESVLGNEAARVPRNLATAPVAGIASLALGLGAAWAAGALAGIRPGATRRTLAFSAGVQNYGYMAIPVLQQLYPAALGVLFVYTLGLELALWTLGIAIVSGGGGRSLWGRVLNPTVGAIVIGLALNMGGLSPLVPAALRSGLKLLGACAVPLGLVLIGATVADEVGAVTPAGAAAPDAPAEISARPWRAAAVGCALRLGVLPALLLAAARWLPFSTELKQVLVVQAAMPAAVLPIVLTKHHRGDVTTAVRIAIGTHVAGVLSIPLWIRVGMAVVGL